MLAHGIIFKTKLKGKIKMSNKRINLKTNNSFTFKGNSIQL